MSNLDFSLPHMTTEDALTVFPQLNLTAPAAANAGEGTVTLFIKKTEVDNMFKIQADSIDLDDLATNDIKYTHVSSGNANDWVTYYTDETCETTATLTGNSNGSFKDDSILSADANNTPVGVEGNHASGASDLKTAMMRNLSNDYQGSYGNVDLFTNEEDLVVDVNARSDVMADSVVTKWQTVIGTNGGVYDNGTSASDGNICKGIFDTMAANTNDETGRLKDVIDTLNAENDDTVAVSLSFEADDTFQFNIKYTAVGGVPYDGSGAAPFPNLTNAVGIDGGQDHEFKVVLKVKNV